MAIKPWSWSYSNGLASDDITRSSYMALIDRDNTTVFSFQVWDDLIDKIEEVRIALGRGLWDTAYATKIMSKLHAPYETFTDAKFNSARTNLITQSFSWAYDQNKEGYLGRLNVKGYARYGDDADFLYGWYILELTEKLNYLISIVNGTADTHEINALGAMNGDFQGELDFARTILTSGSAAQYLTSTARLKSENLPTWTLHYNLGGVKIANAYLELEELGSMLEGIAYQSLSYNGRLLNIPSRIVSALILQSHRIQSDLNIVKSEVAEALVVFGFTQLADLVKCAVTHVRMDGKAQHSISGSLFSGRAINPGVNDVRLRLKILDTLVAERKAEAESDYIIKLLTGTKFELAEPFGMSGDGLFSVLPDSLLGLSVPTGLNANHLVDEVVARATIGTAQFDDRLLSTLDSSVMFAALLELDHISSWLMGGALFTLENHAKLNRLHSTVFEKALPIECGFNAEMVSGRAPSLVWPIEHNVNITADGIKARAGIGEYHEHFNFDLRGEAVSDKAGIGEGRLNHNLSLKDTLTRAPGTVTDSRNRFRLSHNANITDLLESHGEAHAIVLLPPEVRAKMDYSLVADLLSVGSDIALDISNDMSVIKHIEEATAQFNFSLTDNGTLGSVFYVDLSALMKMGLIDAADMETEGGGWQFPTYDDGVLSIYQVYLTEQNRDKLFLDPLAYITKADQTSSVSATPDYIYHASLSHEVDYGVDIHSTMHCINAATWEHPVYLDGELTVHQALESRKNKYKKYVLEIF